MASAEELSTWKGIAVELAETSGEVADAVLLLTDFQDVARFQNRERPSA